MRTFRVLCAGLALLGVAATVSGMQISLRKVRASNAEESNNASSEVNQETLRQVTVVMRHGARAPADTYPNDRYINSSMEPFGWAQLTSKGRKDVYRTGEFLRERYGKFLGDSYSPDQYWLQTSSIDRTKMTAMILSAALWKPNEKQTFVPDLKWQPVTLHYWERPEDRLLIIWNACPRLTMERIQVSNAAEVKKFNDDNKKLYDELTELTGMPITGAGDAASLYGTLKAESTMGLTMPDWTKDYYPEKIEPSAIFSLSENVFTDNLRKLAGGPLVKKTIKTMSAKADGTLKPANRKMFVYVGHDSTIVNMLSAMKVWDGKDPDFASMIMIELHEVDGAYNVQIFHKESVDSAPKPLTVPGCETVCPLSKFAELMKPNISEDYNKDCKVDDPDYVIPPSPPA